MPALAADPEEAAAPPAQTTTAQTTTAQTVEDLGKAVKTKYAGAYDDMPDADLGRRVKAKFPGAYDDYADIAPAKPVQAGTAAPATPRGPLQDTAALMQRTGVTQAQADRVAQANRPAVQPGTPQPAQPIVAQPIVAQPVSPITLPPAQVFAQVDQHAQTLATILWTRAQMEAAAPPVPAAPIPRQLRTPAQESTVKQGLAHDLEMHPPELPGGLTPTQFGLEAGLSQADPFGVGSGVAHAVRGTAKALTPGVPGSRMNRDALMQRADGLHEALGGAFEAATPFMGEGILKAPVKSAASLAGGMVSQSAITAGLKRLGMPESYADVLGDFVGIVAGAGTHEAMSPRAISAIKAKIEPVLKARAAKVEGAAPTSSITGSEPYKPPEPVKQPAQPIAAKAAQRTIEQPGATDGKQPAAAVVDAGGNREGRALHGDASSGQRRAPGGPTEVIVPGEKRSIPARYEVRELADLRSSHNGVTFSANPDYRLNNERDYSKPENQQRVIEQSSDEGFNPRYHVTDNPDMANGPPLITEDGDTMGGNSRTMQLQRVYGRGGRGAHSYRSLLEKNAPHYDVDPEAVRAMHQPVLVRVASDEGLDALPGGSKWAIRKTNVSGTAALSASERAAADAGQMSPEMIGHIAGAIEDAGPDATLNDALVGKSGTVIVNRLIADGFFSEQERPALMDGKTGVLTQHAKDRIGKALLGQFFRDSDQISRTPASIKNKLERIAAPLSKVAADPEWDITPEVREAIDLTEFATAHGIKNISDAVGQSSMFGEPQKWSDGAVKIAEMLRDGKPNEVVSAFRRYVNSKDAGTMFGESTPAEAFRDAFGAEKPERPPAPGEAASREIGPHGPILRSFRGDERGATDELLRRGTGDAVGVFHHELAPSIDLVYGEPGKTKGQGFGLAKIEKWHSEMLYKIQGMLDRAVPDPEHPPNENTIQLVDGRLRAVIRKNWKGDPKTWLLTAFGPEGENPAGEVEGPSAGRTIDVPDTHETGRQTPPAGGSETSVTLGSGLGAFEPFLRESYEDMKALKAKRDAAIEELERSKITPGQKTWGEQVRHYFTGERDLWAARANQGIAKVRKLTFPSRNRRTGVDQLAETIAIAREFKGKPHELRTILDGSHQDFAQIDDPKEFKRVMDRIQALRPAIERALQPMDAPMRAVDQFYTEMATMTGAEGKRVGNLDATWNPETYVPHVLNPKGEGALPGVRAAVGQAMGGRIGKYFGFSQQRNYPTLLHAIMADVVPKTMNVHDAFTIQQDSFARSRATRLLEDQLRDTNVGKYVVKKNAPEGWVPVAPHANEFSQTTAYDTGTIDEEGQPILDTAEKRLYVPKFIADGLKPITSPDFTTEIVAVHALRITQAATKAAQLGLSFFHATTENYMALANMGVKGFVKALRADRDSPQFLTAERDLIAHGGTTSIQGNTVEAYQRMKPGSIPTYGDIWRQNAAVKIMDQAAAAISDFTFANMQRRFKVTDYQLHTAAWLEKNPQAFGRDVTMAKQGIAKEVNAIYGGLHWENIGLNKATVEIARAVFLAPDWTLSNIFNVKYAFEKGPAGSMARMFWARTLVGGLVATQAMSLMLTGKYSKRPTMVFMGHDASGEEIYQNVFFKGAPGDATNLVTNVYDYGLQGVARSIASKGAPVVRTGLQIINNRDFLGHEIAPKGMNPAASSARTVYAAGKSMLPVPLSLTNQIDMMFGPEAHKYTWPERLATMFAGNPPRHVAPAGTHMTPHGLRPNARREENSALDQAETGQVYKRRAR